MSIVANFEIEYVRFIDPDGKPVRDKMPDFVRDPVQLQTMFKHMLLTRVFDSKAIALQRTGKLGTYASCLGHEAAHIGMGMAMQPEDCFAPMYREYGVQFIRGVRMYDVLMYWGGDERGNDFSGPKHDFAWCVPIATQCLHAAGAALAFKLRKEPRVAVATLGDGSSSKGDFYAAINAAGVWDLPLVMMLVNNQWAISVPRSKQSNAQTLAQKGIAGGIACIQVDGNDVIAVRAVMEHAIQRARSGKGATVVEAITYRLSDHTTADDARRYRSEEEVKQAWANEPFIRLRKYLTQIGHWDETQENAWLEECNKQVAAEVDAYLASKTQPIESMFDFTYADMPQDLLQQREQAVALEKNRG